MCVVLYECVVCDYVFLLLSWAGFKLIGLGALVIMIYGVCVYYGRWCVVWELVVWCV